MALLIGDLGKPAIGLTGTRIMKPLKVTADTDYAAGGYAFTAAGVGVSAITSVHFGVSGGFIPEWDAANNKLKFMYADNNATGDSALIEVADGLDALANVVFYGYIWAVAL
jgi:hypothetical protein